MLDALKKPPFELRIPLGTKGTLGTDERTVIGAIRRSVTSEGTDYFWIEYLLYHEMLHVKHPVEHHGGRRCVHTKEFRQAEKQYEHWREAKALLRALV